MNKSKSTRQRGWDYQEKLSKKRKDKRNKNPPYMEWRIPMMIVLVSSIFFVLFTAMFGVSINRETGGVEYHLNPGDDWINPIVDNNGDIAMYSERGGNNPMRQYPDWIFFAMVIGYYIAIGMFTYMWFDYCKWKWKNIPTKYKFVERVDKEKYGKVKL